MRIKEGYKTRHIAGECIVVAVGTFHADLTRIVTFNATSEWLWEQLAGRSFDADTVADLLVERYEVGRPKASEDARKWIGRLSEAGLVQDE